MALYKYLAALPGEKTREETMGAMAPAGMGGLF